MENKKDNFYMIDREAMPELPIALRVRMAYHDERKHMFVLMAEDENCVYFFDWDGASLSWNAVHCHLKAL